MLVADHRRRNGLLLLIGGLLLVALAWFQPNPFASHDQIRARFDDAGGLARVGAEVRIAGTHAGKVVSRRRDGTQAVVTMELDGDTVVRSDATAELRPRLLFEGTAYVDLDPGSPGARPLGDSTLPASQTRTAVSIADALGVLDTPARAALQTDAHELSGSMNPNASQAILKIAPDLLRDAGTAAAAARGHDGLRRAVHGFSRISRVVASQRDDLIPLAQGLQRTAAAASRPALDADLAALPATVADVRSGAIAASGVLDRLDPLARDLRPAIARLNPTLNAVRPLARAATPVLGDTEPLVDDARTALRDAARGAPAARKLLASAMPTLRIFNDTLLGALERKTSLGTPAYLAFLGLFAGGGGASRAFVPGEGHFMRFGFRFITGLGATPPCSLLASVSPQLATQLNQVGVCQQ